MKRWLVAVGTTGQRIADVFYSWFSVSKAFRLASC